MATSGSFNTSSYGGRYLKLSWSRTSYSVADNTSTIKWTLTTNGTYSGGSYVYEGNFTVVINGTTVYSTGEDDRVKTYDGTQIATGNLTISHNSDGSKSFSASASGGIYVFAKNVSGSETFTLDSIPRQATLSSAQDFNDEGNPKITYSNPAGTAVTSLQACIANTAGSVIYAAYRDVTKTGTSYTFSLTTAERNALRNACTTANSMSVKFYLKTVIGGNTYYSTSTKTLTITNATPVISSATAKDTGSVSTTLTGNNQIMIKGYNVIDVAMSAAGQKGATIKSYSIKNGSKSLTTSSGTFSYTDNNSFVFSVTDSRGNTASQTVTLTLVDYVPLTCAMNIKAPTALGDMEFTISGNYFDGSLGATANTLTVQYRYKENDGDYGAWQTVTATKSGNTYSYTGILTGLNYQSTYTFQATAADKIYERTTDEYPTQSKPVFDWSGEDFNVNVNVSLNNEVALSKNNVNQLVISTTPSEGYDRAIYIRPNGTSADEGQVIVKTDGTVIMKGSSVADFVVSQGTSGDWSWRKWYSGKAECWGRKTATLSAYSTVASALSAFYMEVTFPITFASTSYVVNHAWLISNGHALPSTSGMARTTTGCRVYALGTASGSQSCTVDVHVIGTWE